MSKEQAESSNSDKLPKKKKKYLYLDKFEDYKETTDDRLDKVESSQLRITMIGVIVFFAIICTALIWGIRA
jgi:hypothetical protein